MYEKKLNDQVSVVLLSDSLSLARIENGAASGFEPENNGFAVIRPGYPRFSPFTYSLLVLRDVSRVGFSLFSGLQSSWLLYKNYTVFEKPLPSPFLFFRTHPNYLCRRQLSISFSGLTIPLRLLKKSISISIIYEHPKTIGGRRFASC
jgi:hypothetical protein